MTKFSDIEEQLVSSPIFPAFFVDHVENPDPVNTQRANDGKLLLMYFSTHVTDIFVYY